MNFYSTLPFSIEILRHKATVAVFGCWLTTEQTSTVKQTWRDLILNVAFLH